MTGSKRARQGRQPSKSDAPDAADIIAAVDSLYADELQPYGRILRKRLSERITGSDFELASIRSACAAACGGRVVVALPGDDGAGGDWSALLVDRLPTFVDVYSPIDQYPASMWAAAAEYFAGLSGEEAKLPGGRYSCAQVLALRQVPFLMGRSLGQVCHIVQLAISQKKLLGYSDGAVVPYALSNSMLKEACAERQHRCSIEGKAPCPWPIATWDMVRACVREMLMEKDGAAQLEYLPISNVKRLFRSRFHVELSETALGYAKLSELLKDHRLHDICTVQLRSQGYVVVPQSSQPGEARSMPAMDFGGQVSCWAAPWAAQATQSAGFCVDEPLEFAFGQHACVEGLQAQAFCVDEPLEFDFEPGSGPEEPAPCRDPTPALALPKKIAAPPPMKVSAACLSPSKLAADGSIGSVVRNTFIHAAPPPPTPLPGVSGSARQRAQSLPKDMGSKKSGYESACHALGFLLRPTGGVAPPAGVGDLPETPTPVFPDTPAATFPDTPAPCCLWPDTPGPEVGALLLQCAMASTAFQQGVPLCLAQHV